MLNMQFLTRHNQVLILVLLFSVVVQTRRVIRATPGIKTTGQYGQHIRLTLKCIIKAVFKSASSQMPYFNVN